MGCHSMQLTSFSWPFKTSSSRKVRMSKRRMTESWPAVATRWPSGDHRHVLMVDLEEWLLIIVSDIKKAGLAKLTG